MKVPVSVCLYVLIIQVLDSNCLIIPDEVPSLLSLIYSNIPTLKKGTDSRLGWGFRLGDRADVQLLVELGPQTNTQPLRNQGEDSNRKRNAANNQINALYALHQERRKAQKNTISNTDGGKWIQEWSQNSGQPSTETVATITNEVRPRPGLALGEIDAKSVIPDDSLVKLKELYEKHPREVQSALEMLAKYATEKPKTTTSKEDALDNVDLE